MVQFLTFFWILSRSCRIEWLFRHLDSHSSRGIVEIIWIFTSIYVRNKVFSTRFIEIKFILSHFLSISLFLYWFTQSFFKCWIYFNSAGLNCNYLFFLLPNDSLKLSFWSINWSIVIQWFKDINLTCFEMIISLVFNYFRSFRVHRIVQQRFMRNSIKLFLLLLIFLSSRTRFSHVIKFRINFRFDFIFIYQAYCI